MSGSCLWKPKNCMLPFNWCKLQRAQKQLYLTLPGQIIIEIRNNGEDFGHHGSVQIAVGRNRQTKNAGTVRCDSTSPKSATFFFPFKSFFVVDEEKFRTVWLLGNKLGTKTVCRLCNANKLRDLIRRSERESAVNDWVGCELRSQVRRLNMTQWDLAYMGIQNVVTTQKFVENTNSVQNRYCQVGTATYRVVWKM